jgi:hypothetical protein
VIVELLDENQPWHIPLPDEEGCVGRVLEVRADGVCFARWRYSPEHAWWVCIAGAQPESGRPLGAWGSVATFGDIVGHCLETGHSLHSLPYRGEL